MRLSGRESRAVNEKVQAPQAAFAPDFCRQPSREKATRASPLLAVCCKAETRRTTEHHLSAGVSPGGRHLSVPQSLLDCLSPHMFVPVIGTLLTDDDRWRCGGGCHPSGSDEIRKAGYVVLFHFSIATC
jgi:hypothetical protein